MRFALALMALGATVPLAPLEGAMVRTMPVAIASDVFVEHQGETNHVLERSGALRRGDRVVTVLSWQRALPGGAFTVINPLPRSVRYEGSADGAEEVSVDGGRTWGRLGQLRVNGRPALPEEITHVRWRIASPGTAGRIAYRAVVR